MFTFITQVIKSKKKDYLLLFLILTLLSSFEFCFLAMYTSFTEFHLDNITLAAINSIPALAVMVAVVLSVFIFNYFISNKKQEFSILLLLGRKPIDLFIYIISQFGLLSLIAFVFGIGGGTLIMFFINYALESLKLTYILNFSFMNTVFIYTCFLIITIIFMLALSARQFVALDTDLAKYLSQHSASSKPPYSMKVSSINSQKKFPIFSILLTLLIFYLTYINLVKIMSPNLSLEELLMSFTWIMAGEIFIVNTTIPMFYDLFHFRLLKHPYILNAFSGFMDFSQSMITLINLNAVIVPFVLFILFFSSNTQYLQGVIIPCFVMIVTMIALCLVLRFSIYIQNRIPHIATMNAIGYGPHKLNAISFIKNLIFALLGFIVPMLFLIQLFYKAYGEGYLSQNVMYGLIIFYIILYGLIFIYMVIKEKSIQKEVTSNVKYLNRGQ